MRTLLAGLGVAASLAVAYIGCGLSTQGKNVGGFTEVDGGSTSTAGSGGSSGTPCESEAECPDDTDCTTYTCVDKRCKVALSPAGTEIAAGKVPGDCKRKICSGSGNVSEVNADDDPPISPNPCTTKSCADGEIITTIVTDNEPCGKDQYCQAGVCIGCQMASDCEAPECNKVECTDQQCIYTALPEGTEVGDNSDKNDCMHTICTNGMQVTLPDTTEKPPPDAEGICTDEKCNAMGNAEFVAASPGMACDPMSMTACADASTCQNGKCTKNPKPAGDIPGDADGNCKQNHCDGSGNLTQVPDDNDEPQDVDPLDCEVPNCVNGNIGMMSIPDGSSCSADGTRKCCNAVCCMSPSDKCIENMCCAAGKVCGSECCGANETCSVLGDGGMTCTQL